MHYVVIYRQSDRTKSAQLSQALNGYKDYSNHGKYVYHRDGLLDEISFKKIMNGVFIVKEEDVEAFKKLLDKYNATYYIALIKTSSESLDSL